MKQSPRLRLMRRDELMIDLSGRRSPDLGGFVDTLREWVYTAVTLVGVAASLALVQWFLVHGYRALFGR